MEVKEIDHSSMRTISLLKGQSSSTPSEGPFPRGYLDNEETLITLRQRYESVREEKARRVGYKSCMRWRRIARRN